MRVSVWKSDAGYANYPEWVGAQVFVNGALVERVFTADTDRGEVICAKVDGAGQVYLRGEELETVTLYGVVEVIK